MTTQKPLTEAIVKALKAPSKGRTYVTDTIERGLTLQVTASGHKSWQLQARLPNKDGRVVPQRITLGVWDGQATMLPKDLSVSTVSLFVKSKPALKVTMARKVCSFMRAHKSGGGASPAEERKELQAEPVFRKILDDYTKTIKKPNSLRWIKNASIHLEDFMDKRVSEFSRSDVRKWHRGLKNKSNGKPWIGNRALQAARAAVNHAIKFGELDEDAVNPFQGIAIEGEKKLARKRYVMQDEMPRFFQALSELPPDWENYFVILLLTSVRKRELLCMRWQDIHIQKLQDGEERWTWEIPDTKTDESVIVDLDPEVVRILRARRAFWTGSQWVFVSYKAASGHLINPDHCWRQVKKRMQELKLVELLSELRVEVLPGVDIVELAKARGIDTEGTLPDLRIHDLRRTLPSWMSQRGISLQIIGAALGHADLKSTQVYARLNRDPVRKAREETIAALNKQER